MIVDVAVLQKLVDEGYLTSRPHPTADLLIWNYTAKAQYEQHWTPEIMMCRGLITTGNGRVVSSPFKKFMNIEQHQGPLPLEPFKVTEKMDGSLGISYIVDGKVAIATRGSFTSEQAIHATELLYKRYEAFLPMMLQAFQYTYLFEILYPQNRIVCDYGEMDDLVLLTIIETDTGKEVDIHSSVWVNLWPFPIVKYHDGITDIAILNTLEESNREGFVIRFESGLRVKAKFERYLILHKIISQLTPQHILELMQTDKDVWETYILDLPDEFREDAMRISQIIANYIQDKKRTIENIYSQLKPLADESRKAFAIAAISQYRTYSPFLFALLDGKPIESMLFKTLDLSELFP